MIEVLVWLLISTSYHSSGAGKVTTVERFLDKEQCLHVQRNLPGSRYINAKCIQAKIVVVK